jgi:gas vesicle structural protein
MSVVTQSSGGSRSGGALYDVLELILDRGLVIDVFVRVSLVGIEVLTIDARVVVASVDTYLRFAEACNRLDLTGDAKPVGLPGLVGAVTNEIAEGRTEGVLEGVGDAIGDKVDDFKDLIGLDRRNNSGSD